MTRTLSPKYTFLNLFTEFNNRHCLGDLHSSHSACDCSKGGCHECGKRPYIYSTLVLMFLLNDPYRPLRNGLTHRFPQDVRPWLWWVKVANVPSPQNDSFLLVSKKSEC